jgi:hypothetical protein
METIKPPVSEESKPAESTPSTAEVQKPLPPNVVEVVKQVTSEVKTLDLAEDAVPTPGSIRPEIRPHAFVIMPFGKKKGGDGSLYDFNAIYTQLIKPSLEAAGFEAFRADEETTSGDILTDMFQELLLADLCIVDMSIDNANVFYELGTCLHAVRHFQRTHDPLSHHTRRRAGSGISGERKSRDLTRDARHMGIRCGSGP